MKLYECSRYDFHSRRSLLCSSDAFFQSIVTNGSVSQGEFSGTLSNLGAVIATLKNTPGNKIEAMIDKFNDELTAHLNSFNSEWETIYLPLSETHRLCWDMSRRLWLNPVFQSNARFNTLDNYPAVINQKKEKP